MLRKFTYSLIAVLAVFTSVSESIFAQTGFSNEAIWGGEFWSESVWGIRSMANGTSYSIMERDFENGISIVEYSYKTGEPIKTIATAKDIFGNASLGFSDYTFSNDERYIILTTEIESLYRHSFFANFYIYDTQSDATAKPLTDFSNGKQRLATFSPAADKVAFVRDNNVFIANLSDGTETQVTNDGVYNQIINGAADWVYEEEYGDDRGIKWSADGSRLAYYKFDESNVKEFHMPTYGTLYPELYTFKYPKAGEENSKVQVYIYNVETRANQKVGVPTTAEYLPRFFWTNDPAELCVLAINRHQNDLRFYVTTEEFNDKSVGTKEIFKEKCNTYIDIHDNLIFLKDGKSFLWTSERDGYNHIYKFGFNGTVKQLTKGEWDVVEFIGHDEKRGVTYFSSSMKGATQQHIHTVDMRGRIKTLDSTPGTHGSSFSSNYAYSIHNHSTANTPPVYTLRDRSGTVIRTLKDNASLVEKLKGHDVAEKEFFTFTNDAGVELNCWMVKPNNMDPNKTYPVYVAIYGGPGVNTVEDSWGGATFMWHQYLAQEGYIVASVDPRGTPKRGREFEHSTYKELGKLETEDFIDFAEHLGTLDFVDSERIGIQGWSYGGFMTLLCMTKGAEVYNAGISVAPVTNWRYYDSVYTERFMQTPQENASGYDDNSPVNHADKLQGELLLIHGSSDDNVHYQNAMEMANALISANKDFDFFSYPNRNHGIYGGNTRIHLFNMMMEFVTENF